MDCSSVKDCLGVDGETGELQIFSAHSTQTGRYTCEVLDPFDNDTMMYSVQLYVIGELKIEVLDPLI